MDHYTLYLDESETFTNSGQRYFAVGGVILPDSEDASVSQALDNLKMRLWPGDASATGYILHEKEISEVRKTKTKGLPHYSIFRGKHSVKQLYNDLSRILLNGKLTTMGVCISLPAMMNAYGTNTNSKLTVALQLLLENYCHFLIHNNAIGSICYESLLEPGNQELRQRFHELKAFGTMYYPSVVLQTRIDNISFSPKKENKAGLQLADFVPNTLARLAARMPPKSITLRKNVVSRLYDGGVGNASKYGGKVIP